MAAWTLGYALVVIRVSAAPFWHFLQDVGSMLLVMAACAVFGYAVLDWLRAEWLTTAERLVLGTGLGLGVLGLATFGLGLLGWTNMRAAPLVMVVVGSVRAGSMARSIGAWARSSGSALRPVDWAMVGLAVAGGLLLVWSAWAPAVDYDEMEYHLALPKAFLQAGRIHETPENVYSYMPLGSEMLFQAAMSLRWEEGAPIRSVRYGVLTAKTLNAGLALLAACAVAARAARGFGARAVGPAAALFLGLPWIYLVSYRAMAENAQVLFTLMAFVALGSYLDSRRLGAAALGGAMAGLALGAKYLVYGFLFVPGLLVILGHGVVRGTLSEAAKAAALYVVMALVVVSPWMIRNVVWTGNPWHPLLTSVFGPGPHWTAAQASRFDFHHSPHSFAASAIWEALAPDSALAAAPVLLVLGLGALAVFRPPLKLAEVTQAFYVVWVVAFWLAATHRVMRHLIPVWGPMAILGAGGMLAAKSPRGRQALAWVGGGAVLLGLTFMADHGQGLARVRTLLDLPPGAAGEREQLNYCPQVIDLLNVERDLAGMPEGAPGGVGLVGEAQTLALVRPVRYNTVWDAPWLEPAVRAWRDGGSAAGVREALGQLGVATIYVNWLEVDRFRGPGNYGWPEEIDEGLFDAWVEAGVLKLLGSYGRPVGGADRRPHVLYRVVY